MRRTLILVSCLCATVLALYSCSMHAAVTTDGEGHIVEVSSVRVESSLAGVVVAMLVASGQVAVELRWMRGPRREFEREHRRLSRDDRRC